MLARLGKVLRKIVGNVIYWVGWGLSVFVILLAIVVAVSSGHPLMPILLGGVGVILWLITIGLKSTLLGSSSRGPSRSG